LLDIMLPQIDGWEILATSVKKAHAVLMLPPATRPQDRVGIDTGADVHSPTLIFRTAGAFGPDPPSAGGKSIKINGGDCTPTFGHPRWTGRDARRASMPF
jgi:hypothetical protein